MKLHPEFQKLLLRNRDENIFYEKLDFHPGEHPILVAVFLLGWVGVVFGAKARLYRPDSKAGMDHVGMVGGVAAILFWFMPFRQRHDANNHDRRAGQRSVFGHWFVADVSADGWSSRVLLYKTLAAFGPV